MFHGRGPVETARLNERIERATERTTRREQPDRRPDRLADRVGGLHAALALAVRHRRRDYKIADRRPRADRRRALARCEDDEGDERREEPHALRLSAVGTEEHLLEIRKGRAETADEEDPDHEAAQAGDEANHDVD